MDWRDVLLVLACFWLPPSTAFLTTIWVQRRRDRAEAEAMAAEGYPPPDPPTTDSLSD